MGGHLKHHFKASRFWKRPAEKAMIGRTSPVTDAERDRTRRARRPGMGCSQCENFSFPLLRYFGLTIPGAAFQSPVVAVE